MSEAARKVVHALVDEVPAERLPDAQKALEQVLGGNGERRAKRLAALERVEQSWQGQPSTTPEQVDAWIRQSRP